MAFSVESRTPFLDHRLVELCFSLPFHQKMGDGETKRLLRRALAEEVPAEILARRRKLGFSAPLGQWLREERNWRDVRELLLDPRTLDRGLYDRRRLERGLRRFHQGPDLLSAYGAGRVWVWLTLELWHRDFLDADSTALL
jgi:asparagine synthase (glutamine-hydrolysing)